MRDNLGALRARTSVSAVTAPTDGARTSVRRTAAAGRGGCAVRNEFRAPGRRRKRERGIYSARRTVHGNRPLTSRRRALLHRHAFGSRTSRALVGLFSKECERSESVWQI